MTDFENLEKEAFLFAEDLFSDLMSLHPLFRVHLPEHSPSLGKSSHFTHAFSKSVMVFGHHLRDLLDFRSDFNSYSKDDAALKMHLVHLCERICKCCTCKISQVFLFSGILLEFIAFLFKRGYLDFLSKAPIYWLLMFKNIASDKFYEDGGWERLTAVSKVVELKYDNSVSEIDWKYWHCDVMPCVKPNQGSEKSSTNSTEESSGIVTDLASNSVITVKAGLDTLSKDNVETTKQFSKEMIPKDEKALDSDSEENGGKEANSEVEDSPPNSVITVKAGLDMLYEDNVTEFEDGKPSKDPVILKTLELTKQFSNEITPKDEKASDSEEEGGKEAISEVEDSPPDSVIAVKAGLDTLSKDNAETQFEYGKPSKDPVIVKTLELTKQFSKEMTLRDEKDSDSEEEGGKEAAVSEVEDSPPDSVITVKAGLDTLSKDYIEKEFEDGKPSSKDPVILKTLELTKQFCKEMTPKDEKDSDSEEKGRNEAISEVEDAPSSWCSTF